jgi:Polyketide cyclase / dehydrase and lipid transport
MSLQIMADELKMAQSVAVVSADIAGTPAMVFELVSAFDWLAGVSEVERLSDSPGSGSVWRATTAALGRQFEIVYMVDAHQPPSHLGFASVGSTTFAFRGDYEFTPAATGTTVSLHLSVSPRRGWIVARPLLDAIVARFARSAVDALVKHAQASARDAHRAA